jgi:uncharacterized protein YkvS
VLALEKRDELAEIKEKATAIIIREFKPDGAVVQYNSMGEVKGKLHGNHMETVDVNYKMDGTNDWEVKAMEMTKEGDVIMITGNGTGRVERAMESSLKGEVTYMTNSPRLNWLNGSKGMVEGIFDQRNNELSLKIYAAPAKAETKTQEAAPLM